MTAPTTRPLRTQALGPLLALLAPPDPPVRPGPDGAPTDGAAAFLATLAEYEGCQVERLE